VVMFWGLDGYYLYQERLYRALYGSVARRNAEKINFSMNAAKFGGKRWTLTWPGAMFSKTNNVFYILLIATIVAVYLILRQG